MGYQPDEESETIVLAVVRYHIHGIAPSIEDLYRRIRMSPSTLRGRVKTLVKYGYLDEIPGRPKRYIVPESFVQALYDLRDSEVSR